MPAPLQETPLAGWHVAHGGRMVDFAGWRMPVQYTSIVDEHLATRKAAGIFDVSHMGRLAVTGPRAATWLESLLTRRVADMVPGQVRYTLVTSAAGLTGCSVLDDALVSREPDSGDGTPHFALVVNASNRPQVIDWLRDQLPSGGVTLEDHTTDTAMIAVQGPQAVRLITSLCTADVAAAITALGTYRATQGAVAGRPATVSRTGYTGEDGVELVVAAADAEAVWEAIVAAGQPAGLLPCGLGARDTLRLEAGMPLYGHELVADSDPFAIGLGFAVTLDLPGGGPSDFPGATTLRRHRDAPRETVRVGLLLDGRRAARDGASVVRPGRPESLVGRVTSGSYCPTLGSAAAQALVDRTAAVPGGLLDLVVRETVLAARVTPLPFYRRNGRTG